jgi:hypothetical protein
MEVSNDADADNDHDERQTASPLVVSTSLVAVFCAV